MSNPSWQPWQGAPQPWQPHAVPSSGMLASHADRERAVDVLRAGYGEGRLEKAEFDRRVARAYAARTVGELALLVGDLPQGPLAQPLMAQPVIAQPFMAVPRPRTNGKAVGAALCGVLCLPSFGLTGVPAVVLGQAARSEIQRTGEAGDALALLGLVLGWMSVAAWTVFLTLLLAVAIGGG
ncbi:MULTISPECIES: DUF1707 domain-containing protein [unclassified Streptomyces]|uniref:DUF1707 and DUF4190 domain-containing protein n=1 Tax=unclassified Streptomyces TaxID=2593676 RepID=UPI0036E70E0C